MNTVAKLVTAPRLAAKLKETPGIGAAAARASSIKGMLDRQFQLKQGKAKRPSDAGVSLIAAVSSAVADTGTTAIWEQALDIIEAGTMQQDDSIDKQDAWISKLAAQYRQTTLNIKVPAGPSCPLCQGKRAQRKVESGHFWSYLRYSDCWGLVNIET